MGFFTLELAKRVGDSGRVVALDVQPRMIETLKRRAAKAGLLHRIDARIIEAQSMGLNGMDRAFDFVLAFAVVHEMPDAGRFFAEAAHEMKPGAQLMLVEPAGQVKAKEFESELKMAAAADLTAAARFSIRRNHAAVLKKM
jgi:ubiquinone/menaquinone biosynthesis C-methylase UbiE